MSPDNLGPLEETLALLSDHDVMAQVGASLEELRHGQAEAMTRQELLSRVRAAATHGRTSASMSA